MELYEEIFLHLLNTSNSKLQEPIRSLMKEAIENEYYLTLQKIKAIIDDDSLDDPECFMKIEQIVRAFESIGSNGGNRHDFS